MQINDVDQDTIRRLAALRADDRRILTLYLNFDPQELGTQEARASVVTSVIDEAGKAADDAELEHDAKVALRQDVERVRTYLNEEFTGDGAQGVAVFAS